MAERTEGQVGNVQASGGEVTHKAATCEPGFQKGRDMSEELEAICRALGSDTPDDFRKWTPEEQTVFTNAADSVSRGGIELLRRRQVERERERCVRVAAEFSQEAADAIQRAPFPWVE
jgi:hypothetical protein